MTAIPVDSARFRYDDPTLYGFEPRELDGDRPPWLARALSQNLRISERVLPQLHAVLEPIAHDLGIEGRFSGFVFASSELNAACAIEDDGHVLVLISSALIELLSLDELRYVIGHEFAHARFQHHTYPAETDGPPDARRLELHRSAEISADRIGAMCCPSTEDAIRAIVKIASGLGDSHLDFDVAAYLRQGSELMATPDALLAWSTHPPLVLRARAIARFESILAGSRAGDDVADRLADLDETIFAEIDSGAHGGVGSQLARDAAFWAVAEHVCGDGTYDQSEQARMAAVFGPERVEALKDLLRHSARNEALNMIAERSRHKREELEVAPLATRERARALVATFGVAG